MFPLRCLQLGKIKNTVQGAFGSEIPKLFSAYIAWPPVSSNSVSPLECGRENWWRNRMLVCEICVGKNVVSLPNSFVGSGPFETDQKMPKPGRKYAGWFQLPLLSSLNLCILSLRICLPERKLLGSVGIRSRSFHYSQEGVHAFPNRGTHKLCGGKGHTRDTG